MNHALIERKRALTRAMNHRRAVGALLASVVFRIPHQERVNPMVATRDQLRAKRRSFTTPRLRIVSGVVPMRNVSHAVEVHDYDVAIAGNQVVANRYDGQGAQLVFDGPSGMSTRDVHELAVRWLRRRGPQFAPSGVRQRIMLRGRGGGRVVERVG